jgi:archaellum component FlaG (FlaF/FlaG flagellin family)
MATPTYRNLANLTFSHVSRGQQLGWHMQQAMQACGWKFKASGDGTTKVVSDDPLNKNMTGASGTARLGTVTNAGASGMTIAAASNGLALVTGLSGLTSASFNCDKGRFLIDKTNTKAYQIERLVSGSTTSCYIDARAVSVTTGSGLSWEIRDPTTIAYSVGFNTTQWWVCYRGPSVITFSVTSVPSVVIGEIVTQAATGFSAEVKNVSWNPLTSTGSVMCMPRTRGTGAGRYGTDTSLLSGNRSVLTFTPSASANELVSEAVIGNGRGIVGDGAIAYAVSQFDIVTESASMFSTLASSAGCTGSVAPGQGGTGNAWPGDQYCCAGGNLGSQVTFVGNGLDTDSSLTSGNVICVDAIEESDFSADGTHAMFAFNKFIMIDSAGNGGVWRQGQPIYGSMTSFVDGLSPGDHVPYAFQTFGTVRGGVQIAQPGYACSGGSPSSRSGQFLCYMPTPLVSHFFSSSAANYGSHNTQGNQSPRSATPLGFMATAMFQPSLYCQGTGTTANTFFEKGRARWIRAIPSGQCGNVYSILPSGAYNWIAVTQQAHWPNPVNVSFQGSASYGLGPWNPAAADMVTA